MIIWWLNLRTKKKKKERKKSVTDDNQYYLWTHNQFPILISYTNTHQKTSKNSATADLKWAHLYSLIHWIEKNKKKKHCVYTRLRLSQEKKKKKLIYEYYSHWKRPGQQLASHSQSYFSYKPSFHPEYIQQASMQQPSMLTIIYIHCAWKYIRTSCDWSGDIYLI